MRYRVVRMSISDCYGVTSPPPCDDATPEDSLVAFRPGQKTIAEYDAFPHRTPWLKEGINHRIEHGQIVRDWIKRRWYIEIATLEELNAFVEKNGEIILFPPFGDRPALIKIYDKDEY